MALVGALIALESFNVEILIREPPLRSPANRWLNHGMPWGYDSLLHSLRAALQILHEMFGLPEMETKHYTWTVLQKHSWNILNFSRPRFKRYSKYSKHCKMSWNSDHAQKSEIIGNLLHRCSWLQSSHAQTSSTMLVTGLRTSWFTPKNTMALAAWAKSIWLYQCPDLPGFTACWHTAISQMFKWKVDFKWFQYISICL